MESDQLSSLGKSKFSREKRSIILKNRILKYDPSSPSSSNTNEFFSMLKDNFHSMDCKAIQSVQRVQKKKVIVDQHNRKNDWIEEQKYLWNHVVKLEQDIASFIQNSISYQDTVIFNQNDLSKDLLTSFTAINDYKSIISHQLKELKSLLKQRKKSKKVQPTSTTIDTQPLKNDNMKVNENDELLMKDDYNNESSSEKAELLLTTRHDWISQYESFLREEIILQSEIDTFQNQILNMLENDKMQIIIQQQQDCLKVLETDGFTIQIYRTDWNHRYELLQQLFVTECNILSAEYEAKCMELYNSSDYSKNGIKLIDNDHLNDNDDGDGDKNITNDNSGNTVQLSSTTAPSSSSSSFADFKKTGGWTVSDDEAFIKIYKESTRKGLTRVQLRERYATYLPSKQPSEIDRHEKWYRGYKVYKNKLKTAQENHNIKIQSLLLEGSNQLSVLRQEQEIIHQQQNDFKIFNTYRSELHEKLNFLMIEKQKKLTSQNEKLLIQQQLQDVLQQQYHEKSQLTRHQQKLDILEYNQQKQTELEKQLQIDLEFHQQEEEKKKVMMEQNKNKVEQRRELFWGKEEEKRQKKEKAHQLEMQRMEKLIQLASQVPYYSTIQTIESKLNHTTAAVEHHKYIPYNPNTTNNSSSGSGSTIEGGFAVPIGRNVENNILGVFQPLHGYDDKKIVNDVRFKLATALRAAGVQSSEPARLVIQQYHARPHLAIHGIL